jgi:hypothetical protein
MPREVNPTRPHDSEGASSSNPTLRERAEAAYKAIGYDFQGGKDWIVPAIESALRQVAEEAAGIARDESEEWEGKIVRLACEEIETKIRYHFGLDPKTKEPQPPPPHGDEKP